MPFNLGIGGAMQAGYVYALEHGYHMAVQIDGDGQHDPAEIQRLADALAPARMPTSCTAPASRRSRGMRRRY